MNLKANHRRGDADGFNWRDHARRKAELKRRAGRRRRALERAYLRTALYEPDVDPPPLDARDVATEVPGWSYSDLMLRERRYETYLLW